MCLICGGHALTPSTLRKILPREVWPLIWPVLRHAASEGTRLCPLCAAVMDETRELADAGGVRLDICDRCRLIWLDPTEFRRIPKVPVVEEEQMPLEARQALAKAHVELMNAEYDAKLEGVIGPIREIAMAILFGRLRGLFR
jgi:Zn-finger nucleic acid-binding protein